MGIPVRGIYWRKGKLIAITHDGHRTLEIGKDVPYPYCFSLPGAREVELDGLVSVEQTNLIAQLTGKPVVRLDFEAPSYVAKARQLIPTFEADIPYDRRLFVDYALEVSYDGGIAYLDIEVDDSKGFPKPETSQILSIAFALYGSDSIEVWTAKEFGGEYELLNAFRQHLIDHGIAVVVGWNVGFDLSFLKHRAGINWLTGIDLMERYMGEVKGLESYSLGAVMAYEGLGAKERRGRVSDMPLTELRDYNARDVMALMEIDRRYGFIDLMVKIAELVNLPAEHLTPVRIGDTLILRRARELGYVLSNGIGGNIAEYQGALVLEPKKLGLVKNVAVFDFESLYPSIIINEGIDIPGFRGQVLPYILSHLLDLRKKAKELYGKTGYVKYDVEQRAYKVLANMLYGLFGTTGFRFADVNKAHRITSKGRELLSKAIQLTEQLGYIVVYGDTDSIFLAGFDGDSELGLIEAYLNSELAPYRMKLEYVGDAYFLAKKRYILRTRDGRQIVKGIELVRRDWPSLFKHVIAQLLDMLFAQKGRHEVEAYIRGVAREVLEGKHDTELVICKGFQPDKKYKNNAEHVRAAKLLARLKGVDLRAITEVCYVYVRGGDGVMPADMIKERRIGLDYERYISRLKQLVHRFLVP